MTLHDSTLSITRRLQAPRAKIWRAWSEPAHLAQWWCPKPWTTEVLAMVLKPGGGFHTLMRGPQGETSDNPGAFLDVVPQRRIVWTSALLGDWQPAPAPGLSITAFIDLEDESSGHPLRRSRAASGRCDPATP